MRDSCDSLKWWDVSTSFTQIPEVVFYLKQVLTNTFQNHNHYDSSVLQGTYHVPGIVLSRVRVLNHLTLQQPLEESLLFQMMQPRQRKVKDLVTQVTQLVRDRAGTRTHILWKLLFILSTCIFDHSVLAIPRVIFWVHNIFQNMASAFSYTLLELSHFLIWFRQWTFSKPPIPIRPYVFCLPVSVYSWSS